MSVDGKFLRSEVPKKRKFSVVARSLRRMTRGKSNFEGQKEFAVSRRTKSSFMTKAQKICKGWGIPSLTLNTTPETPLLILIYSFIPKTPPLFTRKTTQLFTPKIHLLFTPKTPQLFTPKTPQLIPIYSFLNPIFCFPLPFDGFSYTVVHCATSNQTGCPHVTILKYRF